MKNGVKILIIAIFLFFVVAGPVFGEPTNPIKELSGVQSIADDITKFLQWLIWVAAPIWFLWHLFQYKKADDPGDKKEAKSGMIRASVVLVASQLVLWFLRDYLSNKF